MVNWLIDQQFAICHVYIKYMNIKYQNQLMRNSQIKLNQIVSQKHLFSNKKGAYNIEQNATNYSLQRNSMYRSSSNNYRSSCIFPQHKDQSKLPVTIFNQQNISTLLRCLLYKQKKQMKTPDSSILKNILQNEFKKQLAIAGSHKFIQFLKLIEGQKTFNDQLMKENFFYFILQGKALVTTCGFSYQVYSGGTFGQIQILSQQKFQSVIFQSKFILLSLSIDHFNLYFRKYYQNKYDQKVKEVSCISAQFLNKVPLINKYMFLDKIKHKIFNFGDKIVSEGDQIQNIYFFNQKWKEQSNCNIVHNSPGLNELLKDNKTYFKTIYCLGLQRIIPYVHQSIFKYYIFNPFSIHIIPHEVLNLTNSNRQFILYQHIDQNKKSINFMKTKRVKLLSNKQELKSKQKQIESNFIFLKQRIIKSLPVRQRYKPAKAQKQQSSPQIKNLSDLIKKTIRDFNPIKI